MTDIKFKLTEESTVNALGVTLFRIEATVDIPARGVKKGDRGGFVESTHLSSGEARVSGNAWVSGEAWVFGNAQVSGEAWVYGNAHLMASAGFKLGWFIGGDDTKKITEISAKTGTGYWQAQYVLGDYEIEDLEEAEEVTAKEEEIIELNGKKYKLIDETE